MIEENRFGQRVTKNNCLVNEAGFSMIELLLSLTLTLIILGVAVASFTQALSMRAFESNRTDALTSVQAAMNIMSREISNAGYGLKDPSLPRGSNGIVLADSDNTRLHFRANITNTYPSNTDPGTINAGEDVTFFFDSVSQSVLRYDANTGLTSAIINQVSNVNFQYYDYSGSTFSPAGNTPSVNTARVTIALTVFLPNIQGQPTNQTVQFESDVTLRNAPYQLGQY